MSVDGCLAHAKRGPEICDNALALPIDGVNDDVLTALFRQVLHPAAVMAIVRDCGMSSLVLYD